MDVMEESTIDKSGIIRNVIRLLPKEYQKTTQTEQDLTNLEHIKVEEGITDDDEADKIDAGNLILRSPTYFRVFSMGFEYPPRTSTFSR